jgi:transposase InsO family protein
VLKEAGAKTGDLARRLSELENEYAKLKRLLADTMLDNVALKDLLKKAVSPASKREAVADLQTCHGMSDRRACHVIDADRKSVRYYSTRDYDVPLRERLHALANQRRRLGYRRLHILLRREGVMINRKKTQRNYREDGLTVRRRRSRRRAVGTRAPAPVLALLNQHWSLDFVHDQLPTGRRLRVLNLVDDVTRECMAAVPDTSISGHRVVRELTRLIAQRGKPMQNGYVESFNDRMRGELLNEALFLSMAHARVEIATWVEDYNREQPHSALEYATPVAFAAELYEQWAASLRPTLRRPLL